MPLRSLKASITRVLACISLFLSLHQATKAHDIVFCGERIPVKNDFVANMLMDVIRKQIPNVNLVSLRQRALQYFPVVEANLIKNGLPADFKYLPIVESGFANVSSPAGARGFWQLMPATARDLGLTVSADVDERDDISKATTAACRLLVSYYNQIQKQHKVSSWILTAAAYNFGIGNIFHAIDKQGADYFTMNLNPETAVYVYKMIALKELFEYPELYMKYFGYNVFNSKGGGTLPPGKSNVAFFESMSVKVSTKKEVVKENKETYVAAHVKGKYKDFNDGDLVSIDLDDDLVVKGGYTRKGSTIKGYGWVIDGRVYIDMGYGHEVLLYDKNGEKGLALSALKKGEPVLLKNTIFDDQSQW
jgi:hypothetical protein